MSMYNRTPTLKEGTPKLREEFLRELLDLVHERYSVPPLWKTINLISQQEYHQTGKFNYRTSEHHIQRKIFAHISKE